MKIAIVSSKNTGVDYHRLIRPFALLQDHYEVIRCEGVSEEMFDHNFDVVVFSRLLPVTEQKRFIRDLQKRGTYVICDVDDYWVLPTNHIGYKSSKYYKPLMIDAMMYADEVWTTHEKLGKLIESVNANWYVIPNALDPNEPQWKPKESYGTKIGWAGGVTHFHDLMLTKDAWGEVAPVICGFRKEKEWIKLADNFRAEYIESLDVENYGLLYNNFDIAIAPLERNIFTQCKSNLKILEAGLKGLPIFVENQHPYTDESEGIYRVDCWTASIKEAMVMEKEEIKERGLALRRFVLDNYDIRFVNQLRKERLR